MHQFAVVGRDKWNWPELLETVKDCDVVHVNYEPGLFRWLMPEYLVAVKQHGKKLVLTLHTSLAGNNRSGFTDLFHRIVVHEHTQDGFTYIPMGVPEVDVSDCTSTNRIGTVGFPFPWKGFHQVAIAAESLGMNCLVVAPQSDHCDTDVMEQCVRGANPGCEYVKDWLPDAVVVRRLARCKVNVFAYGGGNYGISGAVRLGIAAQRPLLVTRCRQFRDLFDYSDEIEFCENQDPGVIAAAITRAANSGKRPGRILKDMCWSKAAEQYNEVYQSLE